MREPLDSDGNDRRNADRDCNRCAPACAEPRAPLTLSADTKGACDDRYGGPHSRVAKVRNSYTDHVLSQSSCGDDDDAVITPSGNNTNKTENHYIILYYITLYYIIYYIILFRLPGGAIGISNGIGFTFRSPILDSYFMFQNMSELVP